MKTHQRSTHRHATYPLMTAYTAVIVTVVLLILIFGHA